MGFDPMSFFFGEEERNIQLPTTLDDNIVRSLMAGLAGQGPSATQFIDDRIISDLTSTQLERFTNVQQGQPGASSQLLDFLGLSGGPFGPEATSAIGSIKGLAGTGAPQFTADFDALSKSIEQGVFPGLQRLFQEQALPQLEGVFGAAGLTGNEFANRATQAYRQTVGEPLTEATSRGALELMGQANALNLQGFLGNKQISSGSLSSLLNSLLFGQGQFTQGKAGAFGILSGTGPANAIDSLLGLIGSPGSQAQNLFIPRQPGQFEQDLSRFLTQMTDAGAFAASRGMSGGGAKNEVTTNRGQGAVNAGTGFGTSGAGFGNFGPLS